jgi:glutathione S-transferase
MADLVVYGAPLSPFVRKVEVALREKGLEYELESVNIMPMPDWFAEISPARRIPVLRDRRVGTEGVAGTLPDSSAICAFVERLAPQPALYPVEPFAHGRAVWLEEYADSELAGTAGMGVFRPIMFPRFQGKESDVATARETWQEKLPRHLDYLESALDGNRFFVGDAFSIADIAVGCQLAQLDLVAGPPDAARWPSLAAHLQAMKARPSFQANLEVCGKMLARLLPDKVDLS